MVSNLPVLHVISAKTATKDLTCLRALSLIKHKRFHSKGVNMRIDQYFKIARIVKKRPVSKELANQDRILINDVRLNHQVKLK